MPTEKGPLEKVGGYAGKLASMAPRGDFNSWRVYPEGIPIDSFHRQAAQAAATGDAPEGANRKDWCRFTRG